MNTQRLAFLDQLLREGEEYDATQSDRLARRRNMESDAAALLAQVARIANARNVVEIGTSNGYSTIWLADAMEATGGHLTSLDLADQAEAIANADTAGVAERVTFLQEDGGGYLASLADGSVDLLFLDSERPEYPGWWPHPARVVREGGVMVLDNMHAPAPDELVPFIALLHESGAFEEVVVNAGKGVGIYWKHTGGVQ